MPLGTILSIAVAAVRGFSARHQKCSIYLDDWRPCKLASESVYFVFVLLLVLLLVFRLKNGGNN